MGKVSYRLKGRANPVTKADMKSQEVITSLIERNFPQDSIVSEENLNILKSSHRLWFIDPLDGTVNFSHSFNHFSVSIAFIFEGEVKVGVIYDPCKKELFWAQKGKGSFLNSKRIYVSKIKKLSDSLLATGFAYDRAEKAEFYCKFYSEFMKRSHDIRRCGAASLDMAYVACGRLDGYWEFNLKPWDIAAGKLIVEEAGGRVSDFSGSDLDRDKNFMEWGKEILSSNGLLHKEMIDVIKNTFNLLGY